MSDTSDEGLTEEEMAMLDKVIKSTVNSILGNEGVDPPIQEDGSTNEVISQECQESTEYLKHVPPSVGRSAGEQKKQKSKVVFDEGRNDTSPIQKAVMGPTQEETTMPVPNEKMEELSSGSGKRISKLPK
jgi:hypothetical protein